MQLIIWRTHKLCLGNFGESEIWAGFWSRSRNLLFFFAVGTCVFPEHCTQELDASGQVWEFVISVDTKWLMVVSTWDEAESQLRALSGRIKGFNFSVGNGEQFLSQGIMSPICPLREDWVPPAVWILKREVEHWRGPKKKLSGRSWTCEWGSPAWGQVVRLPLEKGELQAKRLEEEGGSGSRGRGHRLMEPWDAGQPCCGHSYPVSGLGSPRLCVLSLLPHWEVINREFVWCQSADINCISITP